MPRKWVIFRFFNFIQLIGTGLLLALLLFFFLKVDDTYKDVFNIWTIVSLAILLLILTNNLFNLHLLRHHFPAKPLSTTQSRLEITLIITQILINITLAICTVLILIDMINSNNNIVRSEMIGMFIFMLYTVVGIYIMIVQLKLPLTIDRNYRESLDHTLNNLGNSDPLK